MGFFFGEYRGEFLVSLWEFDFHHSHFSGKFCGDGGFADSFCSESSIQLSEFVGGWCCVFSLEVVDEVFIGINGFFSDVLLGEEFRMGWGGGCVSLYNLVLLIVVWGSVSVVWDVDHPFGPVYFRVDFFQPRGAKDNVFISTIDDVEQDLVYDSLDVDKCGGDEFDDT